LQKEIASGKALAKSPVDREEVGRVQGGITALHSANLFSIKVKVRHCERSEAISIF
jgi:hypothetical protein